MKYCAFILVSAAALPVLTPCHAAEPAKTPGKVLFVGNSYTAGSRREISNVAKALGLKAKLEFITPGGCTLARHAANGKTIGR